MTIIFTRWYEKIGIKKAIEFDKYLSYFPEIDFTEATMD